MSGTLHFKLPILRFVAMLRVHYPQPRVESRRHLPRFRCATPSAVTSMWGLCAIVLSWPSVRLAGPELRNSEEHDERTGPDGWQDEERDDGQRGRPTHATRP